MKKNPSRPPSHCLTVPALILLVDKEGSVGLGLTQPVVRHAGEDDVVLPLGPHRLDAQHGHVRHVHDLVAVAAVVDPLALALPVEGRGRVARGLAEEADDAFLRHLLALRGHRYLGGTCKHTQRERGV